MSYIPKLLFSLALTSLAAVATPAAAQRYNFAFDDRTVIDSDFSFELPIDVTPDFADELGFGFTEIFIQRVVAGSAQPTTSDVSFFFGVEGGGLALDFDDLRGAQLFTFSTASPMFRRGTFDLSRIGDAGEFESAGALTISVVPEASTWAMMIVGFGAAGAALRRNKVVTDRVGVA